MKRTVKRFGLLCSSRWFVLRSKQWNFLEKKWWWKQCRLQRWLQKIQQKVSSHRSEARRFPCSSDTLHREVPLERGNLKSVSIRVGLMLRFAGSVTLSYSSTGRLQTSRSFLTRTIRSGMIILCGERRTIPFMTIFGHLLSTTLPFLQRLLFLSAASVQLAVFYHRNEQEKCAQTTSRTHTWSSATCICSLLHQKSRISVNIHGLLTLGLYIISRIGLVADRRVGFRPSGSRSGSDRLRDPQPIRMPRNNTTFSSNGLSYKWPEIRPRM